MSAVVRLGADYAACYFEFCFADLLYRNGEVTGKERECLETDELRT